MEWIRGYFVIRKMFIAAAAISFQAAGLTPSAFAQDGSSSSSTTSAPTSTSAPADGSNTASLSAAKERKVKAVFLSEIAISKEDLINGDDSASSVNYGGLNFDLGDGQSLSLRQYFKYKFAGDKNDAKATFDDTVIQYSKGKILGFAEDGTVSTAARLYLPTGETSRADNGRYGALRVYLLGAKPLGKWTVGYNVFGQYSANRVQWHSFVPETRTVTAPTDVSAVQWASLAYNFTDNFNIDQWVGTESHWANAGDQFGTERTHLMFLQTALNYSINKQVDISAAIYNEINTHAPSKDFAIFRDDELTYILSLGAKL